MTELVDVNGSSSKNGEGNDLKGTLGGSLGVEYVVVGESEEGDKIELPTQPDDGTLGISTLTHAFPGAHGLKYRNSVTGASRALLMDSTGTRFMPPADGWTSKVFLVIYPQRSGGDQNTKRKKMMDECEEESDSEDNAGGHGPGGQLTAKQKRIEDPLEKNCTDLIVLGIPFKTSADTVKAYFETFGEVVMFDLKTDPSGNSKGFGFVRMKDFDAQVRVLSKQVHDIDGRRCQVKIPLSKGEAAQNFNSRIFVGRLPERITGDELRVFFNKEAAKLDPDSSVTDVFIPRPFRSFAFVNFSNAMVAKEIIKLGDVVVSGSSLAVSAAAPRDMPEFSPRPQQKAVFGIAPHGAPGGFPRKPGPHAATQRFDSYSPDPAQGTYYETYNAGQWDHSRGGAYRGADNRAANRFTPGYANSPRYAVPTRAGTSQALASGLDALNLNKMNVNQDVMDAAWQAFWTTLSSQQGGAAQPPPANPKW